MTPNKSDSGELRKEMAGIIAEATSEMMSIIGNPDIQPDEVHPMRLALCKRLLDKSEAAVTAHIQAVGEEPRQTTEVEAVELKCKQCWRSPDWLYKGGYYCSHHYQEVRERLAQYLGKDKE